ncbi:MAG: DNA primase [Planctomycetia bacterium]|nr:DNA primase [Planctomycetia bacterium]
MAGPFRDDLKERVRQAVDIVDLAGSYFSLRRQGRIYTTLCPWHDDSRPSLQVNPQRQSYRCWVCNEGGDIFSLVMKMEGVEFPEALRMLAERAGIPIETQSPRSAQSAQEKRTLYDVMAWAERQYHQCLLHSPEAEPARKYLRQRGISDDSIRRFHLGFAPDGWTWIQERARKEGLSLASLAAVGVLGKREGGGTFYDRFKGRVLFSIRDVQGRPVATGGRILPELVSSDPDRQAAKYINSPETPLFSKGRMLFGMDQAREGLTKTRAAVVVEGYTDCIMAHQFGLRNFVAVLGTALGEDHIRLLRRFAEKVVLVLDGDEAGRKRASEVLPLFIEQQVDLRVLTLPDELDPCDFLVQRGPSVLSEMLSAAADALEHKFEQVQTMSKSQRTHAVQQAVEDVLSTLAKAPRLSASTTAREKIREATILSRLSRLSDVNEDMLRSRLTELRNSRRTTGATSDVEAKPGGDRERELFEVLLKIGDDPATRGLVQDACRELTAAHFSTERCRKLLAVYRELCEARTEPTFDALMLLIDDAELKNFVVELDEEAQEKLAAKSPEDLAAMLTDVLAHVRWRHTRHQQGRNITMLKQSRMEEGDKHQMTQQIIEQIQQRQGLSAPKEG